jgi:hypothetical protein
MFMTLKDRIKHSAIASKKSPVTKRLLLDFIHLIPFLFHSTSSYWLILEGNSMEQVYVLKLVASPCY